MTNLTASSLTHEKMRMLPHQRDSFGWGLLAIVLLAATLRLASINIQSFWYDEAATDALAQASYQELMLGDARDNGNPPLYWLVAKSAMSLGGRSEFAYRLPSVIFGTLAVVLLGVCGRIWFETRVALTAAGLLAISPLALELSTEARAYALLHVLVLANLWVFVQWLETRKPWWLFWYAMTMALACLTHYYALLLPVIHLMGMLAADRKLRTVGIWFVGMLAVGLIALIWLPAFLDQIRQPGNLVRMDGRWHLQFAATPLAYGVGRTLVWRSSGSLWLTAASAVIFVAFWIPALWGWWRVRERKLPFTLLGGYWWLPILIPLLLALAGKPLYNIRYVTLGLPLFLLLVAYGWYQMTRWPRFALASVVALLTVTSLVNAMVTPYRDNWRDATRVLFSQSQLGDLVVVDSDIEVTPIQYYRQLRGAMPLRMIGVTDTINDQGELKGVMLYDGNRQHQQPKDYRSVLSDTDRVWLATCVPFNEPSIYANLLKNAGFQLTEEQHFGRVAIRCYARRKNKDVNEVTTEVSADKS